MVPCRLQKERRAVVSASWSVLKFVPLCSECVLGDDEIDAALYAGYKYEDYEARRDAVYGLLGRSTILALLYALGVDLFARFFLEIPRYSISSNSGGRRLTTQKIKS